MCIITIHFTLRLYATPAFIPLYLDIYVILAKSLTFIESVVLSIHFKIKEDKHASLCHRVNRIE